MTKNNINWPSTSNTSDTKLTRPVGSFGDVSVSEITPTVQLYAVYGLRTKQDMEVFSAATGTTTVENTGTGREFKCTTGTTVGGYGLIRSQRYNRYRPGLGSIFRIAARFPDSGVASSAIRVGAITVGNELSFGYNGTDFGILHRRGGELEIRELEITTPAGGSETATVTLNGNAFNIAITSGTAKHNAFELGTEAYTGYTVVYNGTKIIFTSSAVGPQEGTFSFSSSGVAVGSFTRKNTGIAVTDDFINQTDWNVDKFDGQGPSRISLDTTKENVYEIQHGYASIRFLIEDGNSGLFQIAHVVRYANNEVSPSLGNPAFKVGLFAASLGSTTDLSVYASSLMSGVEGQITSVRNPDSHYNTASAVGTSLTNLLSIRVKNDVDGIINLAEVLPLQASVAVDGTKPALARILINPSFSGEPDWSYHQDDETDSAVEVMTDAVTVTQENSSLEVGSYGIGKDGGILVDLKSLDIKLRRFDVITLAVAATSGTTDATGSVVWYED